MFVYLNPAGLVCAIILASFPFPPPTLIELSRVDVGIWQTNIHPSLVVTRTLSFSRPPLFIYIENLDLRRIAKAYIK
jgi:hypothetical protein